MKKIKATLLGLIAGIALTSCGNVSFNEAEYVKANGKLYSSYNPRRDTFMLLLQYVPIEEDENGIHPINSPKNVYIFIPFYKDDISYRIPESLEYVKDGPYNYNKLLFVKTIGTYLTYRRVYVSSDEKKVKVEREDWKPINAPYDSEVQGQFAFGINNYEELYVVKTSSVNEVFDVDYETDFEYSVRKYKN